jgi:hypothetical protein
MGDERRNESFTHSTDLWYRVYPTFVASKGKECDTSPTTLFLIFTGEDLWKHNNHAVVSTGKDAAACGSVGLSQPTPADAIPVRLPISKQQRLLRDMAAHT